MKKLLIILALFLSIQHLFGQEHLEPGRDFSTYYGSLKGYYDSLYPLLTENLVEPPIARFMVLPSFSSEYLLSLEKVASSKYQLRLNYCTENYWYASKKEKVKVTQTSINITSEFALLIQELFEVATNQIKEPEDEIMGADGTTYYFSTTQPNGEVLTGEIWSPRRETAMRDLVSICQKLVDMTSGKKIKTEQLRTEIDDLIYKLKD